MIKLSNNKDIPAIGFGTWKLPNDETTIEIIENAITVGYNHIDTASAYENEVFVGKGIKKSKIDRNSLFITGKLWNSDRGDIVNACKKTIQNLDCGYLDLYLIHWPASKALYEDWITINKQIWEQLEILYNEGLVKAIGVCNFKKNQLEELIKTAKIKPMVNQIEIHPGFLQKETLDYCKSQNILVEAWSPLGSGKMLKKEPLIKMAEKYQKTVAQLCLKWCLQNSVIPIVKSKNKDRMLSNLDILEFEISKEDMVYLNELPYIGGSGLDSETLTLFN